MPSSRPNEPSYPRYAMVRKLGSGGRGAVYLALDRLEEESEVALKVCHQEVAPGEILREFRLLRELRHPGIARAFDFGRLGSTGQTYFTMEYVSGASLENRSAELRRELGRGNVTPFVQAFLQVAETLEYVHQRGLLHLDLKPSNIVFTDDRAKLIDFGLFENSRAGPSRPARGTAHYIAPEVTGGAPVDQRADLYSLGATFFRAADGGYPIGGRSVREIIANHQRQIPESPRRVPESLSRIILKLLAKSPHHRFQSATDLRKAIEDSFPSDTSKACASSFEVPDFVGRKDELKEFFSWLDAITSGARSRALLVTGERGIGKTRFLDACLTEMLGLSVPVFCLHDYGVGRGDELGLLINKMTAIYGLTRQQKTTYRFLLTSVGLSTHRNSRLEIAEMTLAKIRARLFQEASQLLAEWEDRPVVIVIDDFHRADAQLHDFVRRVSASQSGRLAIVAAATTQSIDTELLENVEKIALKSMKRGELTQSLARLDSSIGKRQRSEFAKASAGSPGHFAYLVYRTLSGVGKDEKGEADFTAAVSSQFETRSDEELLMVLYLRLLNQPTSSALLRELTGLSLTVFRKAERELQLEGLVRTTTKGYRLVRYIEESALLSLFDPARVVEARQRIGAKLKKSKTRLHDAARHLLLGGKTKEGLGLARNVGRELYELGRVEQALELYGFALEQDLSSDDRTYFLEAQGDLFNKSGKFDRAARAYETILTEAHGTPKRFLRIQRKLGGVHQRSGENDAAHEIFEAASQLLEQVDDVDEHLHLLNEFAALHLFRGRFSQATTFANRGLELLRSKVSETLEPRVRALHDLNLRSVAGHVLLRQFAPHQAAEEFLHALKISERIGTLSNTALILNNLGVAYFSANRLRDALRVYNRAAKLARDMGDDTALFSIQCNVAGIRARLGEIRAAEEIIAKVEEMPHSERSKRASLFFLHTKGLIARVTFQDCEALWQESVHLADRLADPVMASYGRVYYLENEILHGRWDSARRLVSELQKSESKDARLSRAIDSRRAYLDGLCGRREVTLPVEMRVLTSADHPPEKKSDTPDYGTLWDWIYGGSALMELGRHFDAQFWIERAYTAFTRLKQPTGMLECCLLLAEIALRQRHDKAATRWLKDARKALSHHDTAAGSRGVAVRMPFLEARLAMLGSQSSRTYVSDRVVDAAGNLPFGSNWEMGWLLELVAAEQEEPGAMAKLRALRARFTSKLLAEDQKSYLTRDHRRRLGFVRGGESEAEVKKSLTAAEKRLHALIALQEESRFERALNLILDGCGTNAGAVFLDRDSPVVDPHAVEGAGHRFSKKVKLEALRQGTGLTEDGICAEVRVQQGGRRLGVLYVADPGEDQEGIRSFLQLAGRILGDLLWSVDSVMPAPQETKPLHFEDSRQTESLVASTFVESRSPRMRETLDLARRTRDSRLPVLLTGESGVGKDLLARWIHSLSPCRKHPFVALDCTAIPEGLWEAELFGYEAGAFTGAEKAREGRLLAAQGGTVYLDNVDAISLNAQRKLLRVLEEGEVRTLGGESPTHIDVRFIASTQRELKELCNQEQFRSDLFYRLSGISLEIPALRERVEDIPELIVQFQRTTSGGVLEFTNDALDALRSHAWPGNVRELESLVRRLSLTAEGAVGRAEVLCSLGIEMTGSSVPRWLFEGRSYNEVIGEVKREYLLYLYDKCEGDIHRIAKELNTTKRSAYQRYVHAGLRTSELRKGRQAGE